jgi:hypothetical protein
MVSAGQHKHREQPANIACGLKELATLSSNTWNSSNRNDYIYIMRVKNAVNHPFGNGL